MHKPAVSSAMRFSVIDENLVCGMRLQKALVGYLTSVRNGLGQFVDCSHAGCDGRALAMIHPECSPLMPDSTARITRAHHQQ
jgi:hypothetical protein